MSVPGVKRPADHFSGALVQMKRPRQELVATSGDVKRQQIIASVSIMLWRTGFVELHPISVLGS